MSEYTLTYKISKGGFHSFYSFIPEQIVNVNQDMYTFKNGNLYKHNSGAINTFYGQYTPSKIKGVFNADSLTSKLYKAFKITGNAAWDVTLVTDLQDSGHVDAEWFKIKENSYFAFVRNYGSNPAHEKEYELRRFDGIAVSSSISNVGTVTTINFPLSVEIGSRISIGDFLYSAAGPSYNAPVLSGQVTNVEQNGTVNRITIETAISGATQPSRQDDFIIYTKESISESNGVIGHYCIFEMTNNDTNQVELFAVESELMKSFR